MYTMYFDHIHPFSFNSPWILVNIFPSFLLVCLQSTESNQWFLFDVWSHDFESIAEILSLNKEVLGFSCI